MSKVISGIAVGLIVWICFAVAAAPPPAATEVSLSLKLRDGSLIMGKSSNDELPVTSEAVGTVKIPLSHVRSVRFGGAGKADTVIFKNGDKLQGDMRFAKITVTALFGKVSLAKAILAEINVRGAGDTAQAVEWETLPFPKNSDWPGDRGQSAEILDDGTVVLHGQPVLSKQTYSLPVTIDCDVTCPRPSEEDGGFTLAAYAPDQQNDMNPQDVLDFHFGYRKSGEIWGGLLCQRIKDGGRGRTIWGERRVEYAPGKTCHFRLTLTADSSRLELGEQSYNLEGVVVPFDKFKLWLQGWRTTDPWRISNFSVR